MHSYCTKLFHYKILLCLRKERLHIPTLFVDFLSKPAFLVLTPVPCSRIPGVLSANVNINYRLPIKVYYRICTLKTYQNRNNSWKPECALSFNMGWWIKFTNISQPMLKLKAHFGFHDLFLKYTTQIYVPFLLE